MASGSRTRLLHQARLAASLQTGPQASALRQLLRDAVSNYALGVHQARGAEHIVSTQAVKQIPTVQGYFNDASNQIQQNLQAVGLDLSKNPVAAADYTDTMNRLASTRAQATSELQSRAGDARSGLQFQVNNLANQLASSQDKIGQQYADLAGQKGKLAESTYLTLVNQEAGRALTRRGQNLSHSDRQAALDATSQYRGAQLGLSQQRLALDKQKARGKGKGGTRTPSSGLGSLTPSAESKIRSQIGQVVSVIKSSPAKDDSGNKLTPQLIRQHLLSGDSPLKKPVQTELVDVAYELAKNGKVSAGSIRKLHALGVHVPKQWIPGNIPGVSPGLYGPPAPGL